MHEELAFRDPQYLMVLKQRRELYISPSKPAQLLIMRDRPQKQSEETERDHITLLSEGSLSEDWNRLKEDAAWAHLQSESQAVHSPQKNTGS
ncbi:hypothetical protein BH23GEM4_BH23GEM4_21610 [soil metagenome]